MKKLLLVLTLGLVPMTVYPAPTVYSDYSSWASATGSSFTTETYDTYDFSGGGLNYRFLGTQTTLGSTHYDYGSQGTAVGIFGVSAAYSGDATYHLSNYLEWQVGGVLKITLAGPVTSIAFDFGDVGSGPAGKFEVAIGSSIYSATGIQDQYGFFGIVSDTSFNTITISSNLSYASIDNLRVAAVPEPETYAMLLAGLGLVGALARRREQA